MSISSDSPTRTPIDDLLDVLVRLNFTLDDTNEHEDEIKALIALIRYVIKNPSVQIEPIANMLAAL